MISPDPTWAMVALGVVVVLVVVGVPVAVAMGASGLVFALAFYGGSPAFDFAMLTAWTNAASYTMTMIPFFVLMGALMAKCDLGHDAYDFFHKNFGKLRGGLAIVTTLTCGLFAAVTGSVPATIVTIGGISNPEMKSRGYKSTLRMGSIASAGVLAHLIPPSIMAVYYAVLTETSVGKVLMAGLIPGIIMMSIFAVVILVWTRLNKDLAPTTEIEYSTREKVSSIKRIIPMIVVFGVVIGGIYSGLFSPTEAAGIGTLTVIGITLAMKRLTWQRFKDALYETARVTGLVMFIIIGAMLFSNLIAISQLPAAIGKTMAGMGLTSIGTVLTIFGIYVALGTVMDSIAIISLFVPLFFPIITAAGFSPIWFGTFSIVVCELGLITPPVGVNLYITQSLDPDVTSGEVIRGSVPFYVGALAVGMMLVFFPQVALWLPSTM